MASMVNLLKKSFTSLMTENTFFSSSKGPIIESRGWLFLKSRHSKSSKLQTQIKNLILKVSFQLINYKIIDVTVNNAFLVSDNTIVCIQTWNFYFFDVQSGEMIWKIDQEYTQVIKEEGIKKESQNEESSQEEESVAS